MQLDWFAISCIVAGALACIWCCIRTRFFRNMPNPMEILKLLILKFSVASMAPSGLLLMVTPFSPGMIAKIPMASLYLFFAGGVVFVIAMLAILNNSEIK